MRDNSKTENILLSRQNLELAKWASRPTSGWAASGLSFIGQGQNDPD